MGIRQRIARLLAPNLIERKELDAIVAEKVLQAQQAIPAFRDYDKNNQGFRPLSGIEGHKRDLSPISQTQMIESAYYYFDTSGLVRRFIRDTRNFTVGKGFEWRVENDTEDGQARQVLVDFWDSFYNGWGRLFDERIDTWYLLGEIALAIDVNKFNGSVTISDIDPANINDVLTVRSFPGIPAALELAGSRTSVNKAVVREDLQPTSRTYKRLVGEVFFEALNKTPTASRGRSDLLTVFDFIDSLEQGLFDELDRSRFMKNFIWDITIEGATQAEIDEYAAKQGPPDPGSGRYHNERVKWEAVTPDLKAADNKALYDTIKSYVAASQNRPDSWLGGGGKAYQTEADLMGEPTFMDLESRQNRNKLFLHDMARYVIDQAVIHKAIPNGDYKISVDTPDLSKKDIASVASALPQLSNALSMAVEQGWCRRETATRIWASLASETGVDVDPEAEIEAQPEPGSGEEQVTKDYQ
jgi:hypothetical protein